MLFQVFLAALLVAFSAADELPYGAKIGAQYPDTVPVYTYEYEVKHDANNLHFGATEDRNGDDTQGSYFVLLPDGRLQTVKYTVQGENGYVADVSYSSAAPAGYTPAPAVARKSYVPAPAPAQAPAPSQYVPAYRAAPVGYSRHQGPRKYSQVKIEEVKGSSSSEEKPTEAPVSSEVPVTEPIAPVKEEQPAGNGLIEPATFHRHEPLYRNRAVAVIKTTTTTTTTTTTEAPAAASSESAAESSLEESAEAPTTAAPVAETSSEEAAPAVASESAEVSAETTTPITTTTAAPSTTPYYQPRYQRPQYQRKVYYKRPLGPAPANYVSQQYQRPATYKTYQPTRPAYYTQPPTYYRSSQQAYTSRPVYYSTKPAYGGYKQQQGYAKVQKRPYPLHRPRLYKVAPSTTEQPIPTIAEQPSAENSVEAVLPAEMTMADVAQMKDALAAEGLSGETADIVLKNDLVAQGVPEAMVDTVVQAATAVSGPEESSKSEEAAPAGSESEEAASATTSAPVAAEETVPVVASTDGSVEVSSETSSEQPSASPEAQSTDTPVDLMSVESS